MAQFELFDIDNPCIGICQSSQKGYCLGCLRSREERTRWYSLSDNDRRAILKLLYLRRKKLEKSRHKPTQLDLILFEEPVALTLF